MIDDYTKAGALFKVRKVLRYIKLYGFRRTLAKVQAQYHMKSLADSSGAHWENRKCTSPRHHGRSIAMIGCGSYAFSTIAYFLRKNDRRFLRACFDVESGRAVSLCKAFGGAYVPSDWCEMLRDPSIKLFFVASNHASHAEYAIECIRAGKDVHIEKPHVVTHDQLTRLLEAMRANPDAKVFLGFNRPRSPLFTQLQKHLMGQPGPLMVNWFVAGHEIPDNHWYFDENEGGRVLGNLCHWTDLTLHLVGLERAFPCEIVPATPENSSSDFVVSVIFADRSCAAISFSAKGHTFEGVREVLNVHRGDVVANLTDFQSLTVERVEKKTRHTHWHRNHGHEVNILNSVNNEHGEDPVYIEATARLFLGVREAIDTGRRVTIAVEQN